MNATGRIEDLRSVALYFKNGSVSRYIMHVMDVGIFVQTTVKLHHKPGVNPYNNEPTVGVWRIASARMMWNGPYWWTSPSLNNNSSGAQFLETSFDETTLFEDKDYIKEMHRKELEAEIKAELGHDYRITNAKS